MKKTLLSLLFLSSSITGFCTTWTINNVGTTFSPATITIGFGDTVSFAIAGSHNGTEVDLATWNANGNTPMTGGFQTPFGGGLVLPSQLAVGTHYFVCVPHAGMGMKGQIIVEDVTGISAKTAQSSISFYPNPATDLITIKTSQNIQGLPFIISDNTGKQVMNGLLLNQTTSLDISALATGVYFLQIGQQRRESFKVIKK